ncbi:hypothetical protein QBC38DRAFT_460189 [Podospora fimiseda]|uniref:Ecp2 effector protein domain-containing protein n=1 Tax=Podospora fimiseda TaxID=252190 RepID=A0AAN6YQI8_9PEZI|nr:hypothetical protein QBC38DRAFT_460189 [Podospora fimiseda]
MQIMQISLLIIGALGTCISATKCHPREYSASRMGGDTSPTTQECTNLYNHLLNTTGGPDDKPIIVNFDSGRLHHLYDKCDFVIYSLSGDYELWLKDAIHVIPEAIGNYSFTCTPEGENDSCVEASGAFQCNDSAVAWTLTEYVADMPDMTPTQVNATVTAPRYDTTRLPDVKDCKYTSQPGDITDKSPTVDDCKALYDYLITTIDADRPGGYDMNPEDTPLDWESPNGNCTITFNSIAEQFAISFKQQGHIITDAIKQYATKPEGSSESRIEASGGINCGGLEGGVLTWTLSYYRDWTQPNGSKF